MVIFRIIDGKEGTIKEIPKSGPENLSRDSVAILRDDQRSSRVSEYRLDEIVGVVVVICKNRDLGTAVESELIQEKWGTVVTNQLFSSTIFKMNGANPLLDIKSRGKERIFTFAQDALSGQIASAFGLAMTLGRE